MSILFCFNWKIDKGYSLEKKDMIVSCPLCVRPNGIEGVLRNRLIKLQTMNKLVGFI